MIEEEGLERILGAIQVFVKRDCTGRVTLLIAKVTDDFLLGRSITEMEAFLRSLEKRSVVGKTVADQKLHFDGCEIEKDHPGNIHMSLNMYLDRSRPLELSRTRRKERD